MSMGGKGHKKRKRNANGPSQPTPTGVAASSSASISTQKIELRAADVATTIDTLQYLAERPELLEHKALRELRTALHPLVEHQLRKYDPIDYAIRVTAAFRNGRGADALLALQGLHARHQTVRQGTIQRWVRDCDSIGDASLRVKLLHAVLRAGSAPTGGDVSGEGGAAGEAGEDGDGDEEGAKRVRRAQDELAASGVGEDVDDDEEDEQSSGDEDDDKEDESKAPSKAPSKVAAAAAVPSSSSSSSSTSESVTVLPPWVPHDTAADLAAALTAAASAGGAIASLVAPCPFRGRTAAELGIRVVMTELGDERQPPNHHDLHIYCVGEHVQVLSRAPPSLPPSLGLCRRVDVPGVPGAFVILNVLSPSECASLSTISEVMGYTPDHPQSRPAPSGIGACEWLLHTDTTNVLLARCRPHLPPELSGGRLAGINARCRFFRYTDSNGAVYRPHIDGSWPGSGVDPGSGKYVHDLYGDRRSRLTFLIYLNDGFAGGCTTFYMPSVGGGLRARGVQPRAGAVLCFPQGNTASLLHEGSAVTKGTKDVIRTDVLYYTPAAK